MFCREFEGKELFKTWGIPVPAGFIATTPEEAQSAAERICAANGPGSGGVVLKAQVSSGGRGKAGLVRFAETPEQACETATALLNSALYREPVRVLLVEEKLDIEREYYVGITVNGASFRAEAILCGEGGTEIEEVARRDPARLIKLPLEPRRPVPVHIAIAAMKEMGLREKALVQGADILRRLVDLFFDIEALTVEINPLVMVRGRSRAVSGDVLVAADSKVILDDSAGFRRRLSFTAPGPANVPKRSASEELEEEAARYGLSYVRVDEDGDIGIIAGGAGLAMATVDMVAFHGGRPANFLDTGGGVTEEQMANAVKIVAKIPSVKGIIINVFGGINNCAVMARGIARALTDLGWQSESNRPPIVVKMRGHSQEEGWALLESFGVPLVKLGTTEEAVRLLLDRLSQVKDGRRWPC